MKQENKLFSRNKTIFEEKRSNIQIHHDFLKIHVISSNPVTRKFSDFTKFLHKNEPLTFSYQKMIFRFQGSITLILAVLGLKKRLI